MNSLESAFKKSSRSSVTGIEPDRVKPSNHLIKFTDRLISILTKQQMEVIWHQAVSQDSVFHDLTKPDHELGHVFMIFRRMEDMSKSQG